MNFRECFRRQLKSIKTNILLLFFLIILPVCLMAQTKAKTKNSTLDSSKAYLSTFQIQKMKFNRMLREKYAFADSVTKFLAFSSGQQLRFNILGGKFLDFDTKFPVYPELYRPDWESELRKRASGGSEQILINPAQIVNALKGEKEWEQSKRVFRNEFIPSNLQLNILTALWKEPLVTQVEIYLGIDKDIPITALGLDKQLKRMVDLGLVERKIISPQHIDTFVTPLKAFQIEASSKNRKNRVYWYRPRVDKNNILQYLLARYARVKEDGVGSPKELKRLSEKLKIVLAGEEGD